MADPATLARDTTSQPRALPQLHAGKNDHCCVAVRCCASRPPPPQQRSSRSRDGHLAAAAYDGDTAAAFTAGSVPSHVPKNSAGGGREPLPSQVQQQRRRQQQEQQQRQPILEWKPASQQDGPIGEGIPPLQKTAGGVEGGRFNQLAQSGDGDVLTREEVTANVRELCDAIRERKIAQAPRVEIVQLVERLKKAKAEYRRVVCEDWPAGMTAVNLVDQSGGGDVLTKEQEVTAKVNELYDAIRVRKVAHAPRFEIVQLVQRLKKAKAEYRRVTGREYLAVAATTAQTKTIKQQQSNVVSADAKPSAPSTGFQELHKQRFATETDVCERSEAQMQFNEAEETEQRQGRPMKPDWCDSNPELSDVTLHANVPPQEFISPVEAAVSPPNCVCVVSPPTRGHDTNGDTLTKKSPVNSGRHEHSICRDHIVQYMAQTSDENASIRDILSQERLEIMRQCVSVSIDHHESGALIRFRLTRR